jgi:hypothetical protein
VSWCAGADEVFGVEGMHVLDATRRDDGTLVLDVETDQALAGCASCGVVAVGHCRRVVCLHDAPCFRPAGAGAVAQAGLAVCRGVVPGLDLDRRPRVRSQPSHAHGPGDLLGHRCVAPRRHHRVGDRASSGGDWHTAWAAIKTEAIRRVNTPERLKGVKPLGVDEHIWRPSMRATNEAVTIMVDLTRDDSGCLHARLLDAVEGRSGTVYADWLTGEGLDVKGSVEHAALDPFRGYANATRRRSPRRGRGTGGVPRGQARHHRPRRGPPPSPARHPGPARTGERPALPDPPHPR